MTFLVVPIVFSKKQDFSLFFEQEECFVRKVVIIFSAIVCFLLNIANAEVNASQMMETYNLSDTTHKSLYEDWKVKKGNIELSPNGDIKGGSNRAVIFYARPLYRNFEVEINSFKTYYNGGKIFFNVCSDEYNSGIKDGYAISWRNQSSTNVYTFTLSKYVDYKVEREWEPFDFKREGFDYSNSFRIVYKNGKITFAAISTNDPARSIEKTFDLYQNDEKPFLEGYIGFEGGSETFVLSGISIKEEQKFVINHTYTQEINKEICYSLDAVNYSDVNNGIIITVLYDAAGKTLGTDVITNHGFGEGESVQLSGKIVIPKGYIPSHITTYVFKNNYDFLVKKSADCLIQ